MSDTPRTDECEQIAFSRYGYYDRFAIARELERELAAVTKQRDNYEKALKNIIRAEKKEGESYIRMTAMRIHAEDALKKGGLR